MVTVIMSKEESTIPLKNGLTGVDSNDYERTSQFIKDYQEVDFRRLRSCKPLPEDLFGRVDGQISTSSIQGTFFLQIDTIEPLIQINNNQNEQINSHDHMLLTLTDGAHIVKAITNDHVPDLNFNTKIGSKLLLTNVISIKDGFLQLTYKNTQYKHGSRTYARPRSARRTRGNGSYRYSYDGRRNSRNDADDGETNFFKRPPPKNTLMDFMTSLNLSDSNENEKPKERFDNHKRRYHNEQYNGTGSATAVNNQLSVPVNNNSSNDIVQEEEVDDQLDPDNDPTHANFRERRNPLPPRLQRAQEERTRRNTSRCYDETIPGNDGNSIYMQDIRTTPASLSSSYIPNSLSATQPLAYPLNSYVPPGNLVTAVSSSTPTHWTYFPPNPGSSTYSIAGISSPPFHNPQTYIAPSYPGNPLAFCYGLPYTVSTYLPPTATSSVRGDTKNNGTINTDNEPVTFTGSNNDENNDSGIKSESSSSEQKQTSVSSNDSTTHFPEEKHRDPNSNPKPRWRIGDVCLARWSEDGEYYYATIVDIQSHYCIVTYHDYNNYDQVRFSDLKVIPRDQQYYPLMAPTSDLNLLAGSAYFPSRANYYPASFDGCIVMPEPPPFPFNSAGTLYMYPPSMPTIPRSDRIATNGYQQEMPQNADHSNPLLSPSKNLNDTDDVDPITIFSNDENQQKDSSLPRPCSIADAPLTLVTSNNSCGRSESIESLEISKSDEEQSTKDDEESKKPILE